MSKRSVLLALPLLAALTLAACGDDDDDDSGGATTTAAGGGGASAGAPSFTSFDLLSASIPCQDGKAQATMSYATENVVSIEIKIGDGSFDGTAGYGPNESAAVAEIPCSGVGESSIQLRGCTEDDECTESESKQVAITAP